MRQSHKRFRRLMNKSPLGRMQTKKLLDRILKLRGGLFRHKRLKLFSEVVFPEYFFHQIVVKYRPRTVGLPIVHSQELNELFAYRNTAGSGLARNRYKRF